MQIKQAVRFCNENVRLSSVKRAIWQNPHDLINPATATDNAEKNGHMLDFCGKLRVAELLWGFESGNPLCRHAFCNCRQVKIGDDHRDQSKCRVFAC